jgi:DNA-binding NtrC family response regulator
MASRESPHADNRILVADDEQQVRKIFARMLRNAGYTVNEAKSCMETLSLLRTMRFRLIVLDLDMPDTDGFGVLKTIRAEFPHVQALVVSGYMHGALLQAAECFGATRTLEKPAAHQFLVETVRKMLGDTD